MCSFLARVEARTSTVRWLGFLDWLQIDIGGQMPAALWWVFGSTGLRRLVQQEAEKLGPWLLAVLEARQQLGLTLRAEQHGAVALRLAEDVQIRPLTAEELSHDAAWGARQIAGELLRLVRLAEAPPAWLVGAAGEARHRALAASLIRLRQRCNALEKRLGREGAQRERAMAAALAWRRATDAVSVA